MGFCLSGYIYFLEENSISISKNKRCQNFIRAAKPYILTHTVWQCMTYCHSDTFQCHFSLQQSFLYCISKQHLYFNKAILNSYHQTVISAVSKILIHTPQNVISTYSNVFPQCVDINIFLAQHIFQVLQGPFATSTDVLCPVKVVIFLVDGIICQVHVQLIL